MVDRERFDEIKEWAYEIDHDDLKYYFRNNTNKNFSNFDDGTKWFKKIQSGEMKFEDVKELRNIFT